MTSMSGAEADDWGDPGPDDDTWLLRMVKGVIAFVYVVVLAVLAMLTLGFVLRLLGASTDAAFTRWVYRNDSRIMEPFRGMFPTETVGDRSVVDFSLLFGMIFYTLVALALHALITWLGRQILRQSRSQRRPHRPTW